MSELLDWKARIVSTVKAHRDARPMKVVKDKYGCAWLCDVDVDENKDLESQGCWRCGKLPLVQEKKDCGFFVDGGKDLATGNRPENETNGENPEDAL